MLTNFAFFLKNIMNTFEIFLILRSELITSFTHPDDTADGLLSFGPVSGCNLLYKLFVSSSLIQ